MNRYIIEVLAVFLLALCIPDASSFLAVCDSGRLYAAPGVRTHGFPHDSDLSQINSDPPPLIILRDKDQVYRPGNRLQVFVDPGGQMDIADIVSPRGKSAFHSVQQDAPILGFTKNVYWVRLRVHNDKKQVGEWILEQRYADTHFIQMYRRLSGRDSYVHFRSVSSHSYSLTDFPHRRPIFHISLAPNAKETLYLRIRGGSPASLDFQFMDREGLQSREQREYFWLGIFYGMMLFLLSTNFFLFLYFKETSYLWFLVVSGSGFLIMLFFDSGVQILLPDSLIDYSARCVPVFMGLFMTGVLLFVRRYMPFSFFTSSVKKFHSFLIALWVILVFINLIVPFRFSALISNYFALITLLLVLFHTTFRRNPDSHDYIFFLIGSSVMFAVSGTMILVQMNLLGGSVLTENGYRAGYLLLVFFITFSLSERVKRLRQEVEQSNWTLVKNRVALEESELKYRNLFVHASDAIYLVDAETKRIVDCNEKAAAMDGYSTEELKAMTMIDLHPQEERHDLPAKIKAIMDRGTSSGMRGLNHRRKDGSLVAIEINARTLEIGGRSIFLCIVRDITEREKNEEERRRFKNTLDQTLDCVFMFHADTLRFIYVNQGALDQVGYSEKEFLTMIPSDIKPEFTEQSFRVLIRPLLDGEKKTLRFETTHQHKDGAVIPVEIFLQFISPHQEARRFVAIVRDITERKDAEGRAQAREIELSQIIENMLDCVISIDQNGEVLTFNTAAVRCFGYAASEVIGKNVNLLMPQPQSAEHDDYLERYLRTGVARILGRTVTVKALRKNGEIFPMRLSIAKLPGADAEKLRFIASCVDITEEERREEMLRRSQKMDALGSLAGGIAHDFNNLLGVMLGYTELMAQLIEDDAALSSYLGSIRKAGDRAAKLTRKMLSFSQRQADGAESINMYELLEANRLMLEKTLGARVELKIETVDDLWTVNLDKSDLEDAILNMSINAYDAMPEGGIFYLQISNVHLDEVEASYLELKSGEYLSLSIRDTGTGMDEKTCERIFEPFFTTKNEKGTGLGMSQVYGFIKRNGGGINVDSEPGQGTCFTLFFPRYSGGAKPLVLDDEVELPDDLRGSETILVVDDEEGLRDMIRQFLSDRGFRVFSADGGVAALDILGRESVDLMLSDIIMPGMDGYELAALVHEKYPDTLIQLISGFSDEKGRAEIENPLSRRILRKPFSLLSLIRRVRYLLDSQHND